MDPIGSIASRTSDLLDPIGSEDEKGSTSRISNRDSRGFVGGVRRTIRRETNFRADFEAGGREVNLRVIRWRWRRTPSLLRSISSRKYRDLPRDFPPGGGDGGASSAVASPVFILYGTWIGWRVEDLQKWHRRRKGPVFAEEVPPPGSMLGADRPPHSTFLCALFSFFRLCMVS